MCNCWGGGLKRSTNFKEDGMGGGGYYSMYNLVGGGILSHNIGGKGCALSIKVGGGGKGHDSLGGG